MHNKIKSLLAIVFISFLFGCSGSADVSKFTAEEYFNYAMNHYNDEDYEYAIQDFQNILLQFSGSAFNDDAQYYLGMTYYNRGQYLLGAYEFSKLIRNIPASPFIPDAQFMLAESYYQLSPPYQLDQTYSKKAIDEFQVFVDVFPLNPKAEEADKKIKMLTEKIAEKDFQSAVIYERMQYERAAIKYYGGVADTYHDTRFAPLALYNKIKLEVKKAMKSDALNDISVFTSRYPNDANVKEVQDIEASLLKQ